MLDWSTPVFDPPSFSGIHLREFCFCRVLHEPKLLAAPAIVFSTLSAYLANPYKLGSSKNTPLEQDVDERGDGAAGQRDENAEHKQDQDDRG